MQGRKECGSLRGPRMQAVTVASLFVMFSCRSAVAQDPDAILKVHTTSIAAGVGYSWGGGMLTFQGQAYPCRIDGLAVGEVGIGSGEAIGVVYNLTNLADFSGSDTAAGARRGPGGGGGQPAPPPQPPGGG